jgi:hypothetical protein
VLGTSNHQPIMRRQSPLKERLPTGSAWIVPGGRYYLLMEDQYRKISLYTTSDGVKVMDVLNVPGQPNILPEFRLQIVSVSRDVFLVGHLFRPKGLYLNQIRYCSPLTHAIGMTTRDVFVLCFATLLAEKFRPSLADLTISVGCLISTCQHLV